VIKAFLNHMLLKATSGLELEHIFYDLIKEDHMFNPEMNAQTAHSSTKDCFFIDKEFGDSKVRLMLDDQDELIARITCQGKEHFLAKNSIYHSFDLKALKGNRLALKELLNQAAVVINPFRESSNVHSSSFSICIYPRLPGGGGQVSRAVGWDPYSKAIALYKVARFQFEHENEGAVTSHIDAILMLEEAEAAGYDEITITKIEKKLQVMHFELGLLYSNLSQPKLEKAAESFEKALKYGLAEAKENLIDIRAKLSKQESLPIDDRTKHCNAVIKLFDGRSVDPRYLNAVGCKELLMPESLVKQVRHFPWWLAGSKVGQGIFLDGNQLGALVLQGFDKQEIDNGSAQNQTKTFYVYRREDIGSIMGGGGGVVATSGEMWHLKCTAAYAKSLIINDQFLHCIIAHHFRSAISETFVRGNGDLTKESHQHLRDKGIEAFRAEYGTHFIETISKGALFLGRITLRVRNAVEAANLRASLGGALAGVVKAGIEGGNVTFDNRLNAAAQVDVETTGLNQPIPGGRPNNLRELCDHHKKFEELIREQRNLGPIEMTCQPWRNIPAIDGCSPITPTSPVIPTSPGIPAARIDEDRGANPLPQLLSCRRDILEDESLKALKNVYTPSRCVSDINDFNDSLKVKGGVGLDEKFQEFMSGTKKVFVLLADAGCGKSVFLQRLELDYWNKFNPDDPFGTGVYIPLRIELGELVRPGTNAICEQLGRLGYTPDQIKELKRRGRLLIILDGQDEGKEKGEPLETNLYISNKLHDWKGAKVVIAGRLNALDALNPKLEEDHLRHFAPEERDVYRCELVEEVFICPFIKDEMDRYIKKFVEYADKDTAEKYHGWFGDAGAKFIKDIAENAQLAELAQTPFALRAILEALPRIKDEKVCMASISQHFIRACIERELIKMTRQLKVLPSEFNKKDPVKMGYLFCARLALKMRELCDEKIYLIKFNSEDANDNDRSIWGPFFSDDEPEKTLRRICSDILRETTFMEGDKKIKQLSFVHSGLKEHLVGFHSK